MMHDQTKDLFKQMTKKAKAEGDEQGAQIYSSTKAAIFDKLNTTKTISTLCRNEDLKWQRKKVQDILNLPKQPRDFRLKRWKRKHERINLSTNPIVSQKKKSKKDRPSLDAALKMDFKVPIDRKGVKDRTFSTASNTVGLNATGLNFFTYRNTEGADAPFSVDQFKTKYDSFLGDLKSDDEIDQMLKTR